MIDAMKKILWKTFAEADEQYLDLFRIGYAFSILSFIVLSAWSIIHLHQKFEAQDWGLGMAALLAGGGVGVGLRGKFEDGPSHKPPGDK